MQQLFTPSSAETSEGDLDLQQNSRSATRYYCADGVRLRLAIRPEFRGVKALVLDVSTGGLGLLLGREVQADTVIIVELLGDEEEEGFSRLARVVHTRACPTPPGAPWAPRTGWLGGFLRRLLQSPPPPDPGCWFAGCRFDVPLNDHELRRILALAFPGHTHDTPAGSSSS